MSKWSVNLNLGRSYSLKSTHCLISSWSYVRYVVEFCTFQREMFTGGHFDQPLVHWCIGIYCSVWRALRYIWMSLLHWFHSLHKLIVSGRTSALQIRLIQECTEMEGCKQLVDSEMAWQWRSRLFLSLRRIWGWTRNLEFHQLNYPTFSF